MTERFIDYQDPRIFLRAVDRFYQNPEAPSIIYEQAGRVLDIIKGIEGVTVNGAILTGFPSYIGPEIAQEPPKEFVRYVGTFAERIPEDWNNPCPTCPIYGWAERMKIDCKPCEATAFRPRDVLKVVPDIDITVIFETVDQQQHAEMIQALTREGFVPPAYDFFNRMPRIGEACDCAGKPLPMDFHVVNMEEWRRWTSAFEPQRSETFVLNTKSWRGVGYDNNAIVDNPFPFCPEEIGTMTWLERTPALDSTLRDLYKTTLIWLHERGATNLEEACQSLFQYAISDAQHAAHWRRLTAQDIYRERMLDRMRENLSITSFE